MMISGSEKVEAETPNLQASAFLEELGKYGGSWVALSADGTRIVAIGTNLAELDQRVIESGEDPEEVSFLRIPDGEMVFSGAELQ